jgi:alpha-glucosidase
VNRDILSDAGREGDAFFIMNTAFSSTAKYAGCTCLGDYIADFNNDGSTGGNGSDVLRAVLNGLVNGGFSGLTHGHCAVNFAVPRCLSNAIGHSIDSRSREMICRWLEMTAFTSFFRTHDGGCGARECEGNGNSMLNAQDDDVVLRSLARWSHVFVALSEYRLRLLNDASFKGYPVVRHPSMHYPNDVTFVGNDVGKKDDTSACSSTFMMGDLIYVAPVLKCGVVKSKVYLPQGAWIHLWVSDVNIL